ncbi:hypothetical protein MPER_13194 [Moniliophthora perniciosa FA553]|nr:hypothetical protein MPER_13194 [Moniliophthora perniciosa FA553]
MPRGISNTSSKVAGVPGSAGKRTPTRGSKARPVTPELSYATVCDVESGAESPVDDVDKLSPAVRKRRRVEEDSASVTPLRRSSRTQKMTTKARAHLADNGTPSTLLEKIDRAVWKAPNGDNRIGHGTPPESDRRSDATYVEHVPSARRSPVKAKSSFVGKSKPSSTTVETRVSPLSDTDPELSSLKDFTGRRSSRYYVFMLYAIARVVLTYISDRERSDVVASTNETAGSGKASLPTGLDAVAGTRARGRGKHSPSVSRESSVDTTAPVAVRERGRSRTVKRKRSPSISRESSVEVYGPVAARVREGEVIHGVPSDLDTPHAVKHSKKPRLGIEGKSGPVVDVQLRTATGSSSRAGMREKQTSAPYASSKVAKNLSRSASVLSDWVASNDEKKHTGTAHVSSREPSPVRVRRDDVNEESLEESGNADASVHSEGALVFFGAEVVDSMPEDVRLFFEGLSHLASARPGMLIGYHNREDIGEFNVASHAMLSCALSSRDRVVLRKIRQSMDFKRFGDVINPLHFSSSVVRRGGEVVRFLPADGGGNACMVMTGLCTQSWLENGHDGYENQVKKRIDVQPLQYQWDILQSFLCAVGGESKTGLDSTYVQVDNMLYDARSDVGYSAESVSPRKGGSSRFSVAAAPPVAQSQDGLLHVPEGVRRFPAHCKFEDGVPVYDGRQKESTRGFRFTDSHWKSLSAFPLYPRKEVPEEALVTILCSVSLDEHRKV